MKEFSVEIKETLKKTVTVEAETQEEAEQLVGDNWRNSEYILDAEDFSDVEFTALENEPEKIQVVVLKPGKYAEITQIEDTQRSARAIVGGEVECLHIFNDNTRMMVCEDEKVYDKPPHRAIYSEPKQVDMSLNELFKKFREKENDETGTHITGYITFTSDTFTKPYSEEARTYEVSSDNKAFQPDMGGYSIYGSSLDGEDICTRLDGYLHGKNPWKVERCYIIEGRNEIVNTISFTAFICGYANGRLKSLTDEQAKKYAEKFKFPEHFERINGEIKAFSYLPTTKKHERGDYR